MPMNETSTPIGNSALRTLIRQALRELRPHEPSAEVLAALRSAARQ